MKLPTIWTDEKQPGRNSDVEKVRREKMQVREKVGKSRNTVFSILPKIDLMGLGLQIL